MMITKTCDRKKRKRIEFLCQRSELLLWCICFEVRSCHKLIYYCSYIIFYNKQWYNIYLGVLDLSNDI